MQDDINDRIERGTTTISRIIVGLGLLVAIIALFVTPPVGMMLLPCVWIVHLLDRIRISVYAMARGDGRPGGQQ